MDGSDSPVAFGFISPRWFWLIALAVCGLAVFFELGRMDVWSDNEGQRAAPPLEMIASGDWTVPTLNGETYLKKPPLLYWAIAGVYAAAGEATPFLARVPVALSAIALSLGVYFFVRRNGAEGPARWAALMVFATPYALERMRMAGLDIPLTLMTFLAVAALNGAMRAPAFPKALGMACVAGLFMGAAMMLKAPACVPAIGAAWGVHILLEGRDPDAAVRTGIKWSVIALAVGAVLWTISMGFGLYVYQHLEPNVPPSGTAYKLHKLFGTPVGLGIAGLAWAVLVLRAGGRRLPRHILLGAAMCTAAAAVIAPWCLAVYQRMGWPYLAVLLKGEVLDRTQSATPINSGSPFYYLLALPLMLAPWGFLLPLQCAKSQWQKHGYLYRFGLLTGWLTVLAFSLVAGKEYEYILPGITFLLIPTAYHLAEFGEDAVPWMARWRTVWQRFFAGLFVVAAAGLPIYIVLDDPRPVLIAESVVFAAVALVFAARYRKATRFRLEWFFAMFLCGLMIGMLSRNYHYTGKRSPKALAQCTGEMLRAGHTVESARVSPAFAFYARIPVPENIEQDDVRRKLLGPAPYYYIIREKYLDEFAGDDAASGKIQTLMGPYTSKKLLLIGNAPLPEGIE